MSYPDFIADRDGLDLWRKTSREGNGHEMVANKNTVFRFVQTVDRLEKELAVAREVMRQIANHYPMGVNPFLDDAARKARAALEQGGQS